MSQKKLTLAERQSIANSAIDSIKELNRQTQVAFKKISKNFNNTQNLSNFKLYKNRVNDAFKQNKITILIGIISIFLSIILITLFVISQREKHSNTIIKVLNDYSNIISILIGIGLAFSLIYFLFYFSKTVNPIGLTFKNIGISFGIIISTIIFLTFVYFITYSVNNFSFFSFITNIGLVLFSLYMLNYILSILFPKSEYLTLIRSTLFLIPCFIIDNILYPVINLFLNIENKYEYKYLILLIIQILFILAYFYYDKLLKYIYSYNGTLLLDEPKYLNQEYTIGNYENLVGPLVQNNNTNNQYNYNYGIQTWIYLENQPPNSTTIEYTPIFRYGQNPVIEYNSEKNSLRVTIKDSKDNTKVIYESNTLPIQTWNHFVINYTNGFIDLFINNNLVATVKSEIPYMKYDSVITGKTNGVSGGISNVVYFKSPMTRTMIDIYYRLFRNKTIPKL